MVLNRVAMSSFLRQEEHALFYAEAVLDHWRRLGARVMNGAERARLDTNKARQLWLFRQAGLAIPADPRRPPPRGRPRRGAPRSATR